MSIRKPLDESNDATEEVSDFMLSRSNDNDGGTIVLVTFELAIRFFGGNGGGDSPNVLNVTKKFSISLNSYLFKFPSSLTYQEAEVWVADHRWHLGIVFATEDVSRLHFGLFALITVARSASSLSPVTIPDNATDH